MIDCEYYVYKTGEAILISKTQAGIALNMDKAGNSVLNEEYCFFDGKHKRCKGFITLTESMYHPLLHQQIALATMHTESENTETAFFGVFSTKYFEKFR